MRDDNLKSKLTQKQRLALSGWIVLIVLLFNLPLVQRLTSKLTGTNALGLFPGCADNTCLVAHLALLVLVLFVIVSFVPLPLGNQ